MDAKHQAFQDKILKIRRVASNEAMPRPSTRQHKTRANRPDANLRRSTSADGIMLNRPLRGHEPVERPSKNYNKTTRMEQLVKEMDPDKIIRWLEAKGSYDHGDKGYDCLQMVKHISYEDHENGSHSHGRKSPKGAKVLVGASSA